MRAVISTLAAFLVSAPLLAADLPTGDTNSWGVACERAGRLHQNRTRKPGWRRS